MVETASPFISAATPPPVTIPRMDEIHSSIKTRLKVSLLRCAYLIRCTGSSQSSSRTGPSLQTYR